MAEDLKPGTCTRQASGIFYPGGLPGSPSPEPGAQVSPSCSAGGAGGGCRFLGTRRRRLCCPVPGGVQRNLGPERGGRSPGWRCVGGRRGLQPHAHGRPRLAAAARADRNLKARNGARRGRSERGAGRGGACGRPTSGNPRPAVYTLSNRIARRASLALCQRFLRTVRQGDMERGADVLTSGSRAFLSCDRRRARRRKTPGRRKWGQ